jgi:hypothetical protein
MPGKAKGTKVMTKTGLIESFVSIPAGTLICDVIRDRGREPEAAFLLKDKQIRLDLIPRNQFDIEFRCSHIILDDVLLVPLLMRFCQNPDLTYETWFNYHQSEEVKKCFSLLAAQETIRLLLVNECDQSVDVIHVSNNLRLGFLDSLGRFQNRLPWTESDFEYAKNNLLRLYPNTGALWNGLKERLRPGLKINQK